jgi:hypothetical protein
VGGGVGRCEAGGGVMERIIVTLLSNGVMYCLYLFVVFSKVPRSQSRAARG